MPDTPDRRLASIAQRYPTSAASSSEGRRLDLTAAGWAIAVSFTCILLAPDSSAAQSSASYSIHGATLNVAGGLSSSASFEMNGCLLPDPVAGGRASSTTFVLTSG